MAVLPILTGPDHPILRKRTAPLTTVTKETLALLRDMEETMEHANGVGLAAPQIGVSLRLCIALLDGTVTQLLNPAITWRSDESDTDEEGCLSLPGIWVPVPRPRGIVVRFEDARKRPREAKLTGLPARIVQHEVDHLDGVLIVDYLAGTPGHDR